MSLIGPFELELVDKLLSKGIRRLDVLSSELKRTERALRYSLAKLNNFFNKYHGLEFAWVEGQYVKSLLTAATIRASLAALTREHYHMSLAERIELSKFCYLADLGFTIEELAEFMNISLSTLKQTIPLVRDTFTADGLSLVNVHRLGLRVEGAEGTIRKKLANHLYRNYNLIFPANVKTVKGNPYFKEILHKYLERVPTGQLREIIDKYEAAYAVFNNDEFYKLALADLIVIYKRGLSQSRLGLDAQLSPLDREKILFLQKEFSQNLNLGLPEAEFYDFASNIGGVFVPNKIPWDVLLTDLLNKLLDMHIPSSKTDLAHPRITEAIGIFKRHFYFAVDRVKKDLRVENPLLDEIKKTHKVVFDDLQALLVDVEKRIGKKFSENEIGYFTILVENILATIVSENKQVKNIIVLCGMGYGTSKLLTNNIRHYFKVNIIDVIPYHRLDRAAVAEADLIISTMPLADRFKDMLVQVSPLMTDEDLGILRNAGLRRKKSSSLDAVLAVIGRHCQILDGEKLKKELADFFGEESEPAEAKEKYARFLTSVQLRNIALRVRASHWKEAVQASGLLLVKNGSVDISYVQAMIRNIEVYGSYMVVGDSLLPHAENKGNVFKTDFGLVTLERAVHLDEKTAIKTIFSFSSVDEREHIDVLIDFMSLIENEGLLEHIGQFKCPLELIQFIENRGF